MVSPHFIHRAGIVHRDLKPANIMITSQGHTKVMDFGLAKRVLPGGGTADLTRTLTQASITQQGSIAGTISYISPEQARGENVDTRSDIFSLGIILYEMLSGKHAFSKSSPVETLTSILRDAVPPTHAGHTNLAFAYFLGFRMPEAYEEGLKAVELDPEFLDYRYNQSWYAQAAGNFERARQEVHRALAIDPKYEKAFIVLALVELGQGRPAEAALKLYSPEELPFAAAQVYLDAGQERMTTNSATLTFSPGRRCAPRWAGVC